MLYTRSGIPCTLTSVHAADARGFVPIELKRHDDDGRNRAATAHLHDLRATGGLAELDQARRAVQS